MLISSLIDRRNFLTPQSRPRGFNHQLINKSDFLTLHKFKIAGIDPEQQSVCLIGGRE